MSVPLLQTAEYVREYGDELAGEEKAVLLQVFQVGELSEIADAYNRDISDPVKNLFLEYPTRQEMWKYIHLWWSHLKKHPLSYVRTYLRHCGGYFVLDARPHDDIIGWFARFHH